MMRLAFCHSQWIPNKPEWLRALSCLQMEEQQRINRLAYQRDAKAALVGRLMMRKVISRELGLKSTEFHIGRTTEGRPYLSKPIEPFDFNISHHGEYTVLCAAHRLKVGIDIMRVELPAPENSVETFFAKIRKFLTPTEWNTVRNSGDEIEQMRTLYRHWCLKEAYVKALGKGLTFDLSKLECRLTGENQPIAWCGSADQVPHLWQFEEHALPNNHHAAITWHGENLPPFDCMATFTMVTFDDLIIGNDALSKVSSDTWDVFREKPALPLSRRRLLMVTGDAVAENQSTVAAPVS